MPDESPKPNETNATPWMTLVRGIDLNPAAVRYAIIAVTVGVALWLGVIRLPESTTQPPAPTAPAKFDLDGLKELLLPLLRELLRQELPKLLPFGATQQAPAPTIYYIAPGGSAPLVPLAPASSGGKP
jgi:hypothetical protein